jgi:hypothetical protein
MKKCTGKGARADGPTDWMKGSDNEPILKTEHNGTQWHTGQYGLRLRRNRNYLCMNALYHYEPRPRRPPVFHPSPNRLLFNNMRLHRPPEQRGLALRDRGGNVEVMQYQGLVLKASYWRWPDRDMAGNAIDFYVKVLGASFHDAMKELSGG